MMGEISPDSKLAADIIRDFPRKEILPDLLVKKLNIDRWTAVAIMRELAGAGFGTFVLGRKGGKTRLEKASVLPETESISSSANAVTGTNELSSSELQTFSLRRPNPVSVSVPADLTKNEAEKLSRWLQLIADDSK